MKSFSAVTFSVLMFATFQFMPAACGQQDHVDGVAAVVEGQVVTFLEVRQELERFRKGAPGEFTRIEREQGRLGLYRYAANILIENELLYAEVLDRQIKLPAEYIDSRIQTIISAEAGGDWKKFNTMLIDSGQDMKTFRSEVEKRVAAELLVEELVRRAVSVGPAEVAAYYQANRHLFVARERARLGLIYLARQSSESPAQLAARVEAVRKRLAEGESFAELARELSNDSTAANGGDLGWQALDDLSQAYREAIRGVKPGSPAVPVQDEKGAHLLHVFDYEAPAQLALTEPLQKQVEMILRQQKERVKYQQLIDELKEKFYIKNFISEDSPND